MGKSNEKKKKTPPKQTVRIRKGSFLRTFLFIVIGLAVLGILFLITAKPVFNIDLRERLKQNRTIAGSEAVLTEMRELFFFQTVEYVYKTVFPFDYVPAVYDWRPLLEKEKGGKQLTKTEKEFLLVYRFCQDLGINLEANKLEFVVVTAVVRGGFDLEEMGKEDVRIDEETKTLYLRLPKPEITGFEIEDIDRRTYSYPDFEISPDNWRRLTRFTAERIEKKVLQEGILELALEKGKGFIEKLLLDAGLEKVVFLE